MHIVSEEYSTEDQMPNFFNFHIDFFFLLFWKKWELISFLVDFHNSVKMSLWTCEEKRFCRTAADWKMISS